MSKYLVAFISGLLSDFWLSACTYCVNHDSFAALFFFNLTYPIINLVGISSVVEEKEKKGKIKLACTIGVGYAIGSSIFFLYFREYFK
jgi:hypothetical protein